MGEMWQAERKTEREKLQLRDVVRAKASCVKEKASLQISDRVSQVVEIGCKNRYSSLESEIFS